MAKEQNAIAYSNISSYTENKTEMAANMLGKLKNFATKHSCVLGNSLFYMALASYWFSYDLNLSVS